MIKVNGITVQYDDRVIFDGYSKDFEENKVYAILGKSGCGKSTLLRTIAGLVEPNKGEVVYNKTKVSKPIKEIFMMHQNYSNFPWMTCLQNVLFPIKIQGKVTKEHIEKATNLLKRVGLEEYINRYPYELSGGMKQRLALARTLLTKPPVILMDEPLSALDPKTRSDMQNLILQLHYETKDTIIMVTHDPEEAKKMADEIVNL